MSKTKNKERNRNRHEFLLTFFDKPHRYEVKEINGFTLVRQFNATNHQWEVAIWPPDLFSKVYNYNNEVTSISN